LQRGLKLSVLGELTVMRDGETVALPRSRKTRALLAYLAVVPRAQRRERLCEMFWPVPDDPRAALRWSLWNIRRIVGAEHARCLRADRDVVALDHDQFDCDLRVISFSTLQELDRRTVGEIEAIVESIRGEFLEDLSLPGCPGFEAWRIAHADRISVLQLRALRLLVDRTQADPVRALHYAQVLQALVPDDPVVAQEVSRLAVAARRFAVAQPSACGELWSCAAEPAGYRAGRAGSQE
jgi:DNA-binding SARP family transcriptional activator